MAAPIVFVARCREPSRRADPGAAHDFSPSISPDSAASESGPKAFDTTALQRMQTSRRRLRKRYRLSHPEMI
ncbi:MULTISPECIES: hypothetical protein [unclassified Burkholderia]|uniref:hypothetical protein n=1 Tax=unclassified Burkholderia TaxID=2613784 RepID=UPI000A63BAF6|nr:MULTISPECIES: hypothetical protein [unclassified Burkholderia]